MVDLLESAGDTATRLSAARYTLLVSRVMLVVRNLDRLTPRQLEVAEMVALTDMVYKQIAAELKLNHGTVAGHVKNIRFKLGLTGYDIEVCDAGPQTHKRWVSVLAFALGVKYSDSIKRLF